MRLNCLVCPAIGRRVQISISNGIRCGRSLFSLLMLLALLASGQALHAQATTSTTLSITNTSGSAVTSVSSGTVVVLTATVKTSSNVNVTAGLVNFCDYSGAYCEDAHLIGSAQLRSNGQAIYKFRPAPGTHQYYARFVGTTSDEISATTPQTLTVTGGPFSTTTSIAQSGSAGNFTLTGTVTSGGTSLPSPTGTVDFIDTTNGNYVLGTSTLTPGPTSLTYASPVSSAAASGPEAIYSVMADFNQDGIPDIAVLEVYGDPNLGGYNVVDIYFGNADGTFTKQTPIQLTSGVPTEIAVGDLNGDGYPDLVLSGGEGLYVILNNGSGGFNAPVAYNLGYTDWAGNTAYQYVGPLAVADINHDGHQDVVFGFQTAYFDPETTVAGQPSIDATAYSSFIGVALGNGDGTLRFSGTPPYVSIYGSQTQDIDDLKLADLTGNGNLDLITVGDDGYGCVLPGNGDGTFQNVGRTGGPEVGLGPTCFLNQGIDSDNVVVADFNGDGKPDLAVDNTGGNEVGILLGNGDRTFQDPLNSGGNLVSLYQTDSGTRGLIAADLNGDGIPDIATANTASGTVTVMLGNGDGTFKAPLVLGDGSTDSGTALSVPAGDEPFWIQAGNFTGNGIPTIAVTSESSTDPVVNTIVGSATTTATTTVTGISPVGATSSSDSVVASYEGDDYYTDSTSSATALNDEPVPTALALQSNTASAAVGQQITLTATLSPTSAQGYSANTENVTFFNNGTPVGTAPLSGGVAVLHLTPGIAQTYSFTASYAGDNNFNASNSASPVSVTVQSVPTALTLQVCSPVGSNLICPITTMTYGEFVQLNVTLAPNSVSGGLGSTTQGETVTFYNNGTSVGTATLDQYGNASMTLSEPNAGSYSFTASYPGDSNYNASSTAAGAPLTIQQATSGMSMTVSPQPTASYGTTVFLNARFSPYQGSSDTTNGETVTFYNNGTSVGTATLSGENAQLTLTNLPVGPYTFTVRYPGDQNFTASNSGSSPQSLSVQKDTTLLGVDPEPGDGVSYGAPIFLQAHLSPSSVPGGNSTDGETITFLDNGTPIGTGTLSSGNASFNDTLPATGNHSFAAAYAGDASFASSNAVASGSVVVQPDATTIGINSTSPTTVASGATIPLTANLNPYAVAGGASTNGESVTFLDNGTSIGTGTLSNGIASFSVTNVAQGTHAYAVRYAGDGYFAQSSSSNQVTINALPASTLTLTTSPLNYATPTQSVSLTATLSPASHATDGESINFFYNGNELGSATLSDGMATLTEPNGLVNPGNYSFTAQYQGDGFLSPSTSSAVPFLVATTEAFVVNSAADDTNSASYCSPQSQTTRNTLDTACTLRDALLAAAAAPEGATINFDNTVFTAAALVGNPSANTITLNEGSGTLTVPSNTSITGTTSGTGATLTNLVTVNGGGNGDPSNQDSPVVFTVTGTGVAISNLTITGGWGTGYSGYVVNGGGIVNSGTLTLNYSEVTGNGSVQGDGGGIYNTGTLTIIGSTIDNNQAATDGIGTGGGIYSTGTLTIINSTIANNGSRANNGGGIDLESGTLTMTNSTVTANAPGGGIYNGGGTLTLANSIVSNNNDTGFDDLFGTTTFTDQGGNIVGWLGRTGLWVNSNGVSFRSDQLGLGTLGNYGGPTPTTVPLPGSQAICAALYSNSPSQWSTNQIDIDQRGFPNYNIHYGQLANTGGPLPSVCYDSGAVQTNYTAVQFAPTSYTSLAGSPTTSPVVVSVIENGQSLGNVPVTVTYSGPGNLSGNTGTTTEGAGLTLSGLSVDSGGSGNLSAKLVIAGTSYISGSAGLTVEGPVQINPGAETLTAVEGRSFLQGFAVSGASGSYQLSSSGTLPSGMTLTPSGAGTGSSWTLSGTPTQSGTFSITLTATDASNSSLTTSQNYTLIVWGPVQITPGGENLSASTGTFFSQTFTVSGGTGNFQFLNTGNLPSGLTLSQSGSGWTLSGTPTQTGGFVFNLTAVDESINAWESDQQYTLVVSSPVSGVTLTAAPGETAWVGQTVALTATISPVTATGTVTFYDNGNPLGSREVTLHDSLPTAKLGLNAGTPGSPLALGAHSFTAQYSGDGLDAASTSNTVNLNVVWPTYVVNTVTDSPGTYQCTPLLSSRTNTVDGNNGGTSGLCTLRQALNEASAVGGASIHFDATVFAASNLTSNPWANVIAIDVPDNGGGLSIGSNTTIQGLTSGNGLKRVNLVTVDGGGVGVSGNGTIFVVSGMGNAINNLNINNGFADGGNGGAITNFGTITITNSSFTGNQASQSGGAIFNILGPLTIVNSTFNSNSADGGNGGGIENANYSGCGVAIVTNSTFYQNSAANGGSGSGGAINNEDGGCSLSVTNSTLVGNTTDNANPSGGGISNASGSTFGMANSIVSGNVDASGNDDLSDGGIGGNFFDGANIVNGNLAGVYNGNPENGASVGLAGYGSYGGPTQSMIPLPGSAAICAGLPGNITSGVTTDQRGEPNQNTSYSGYSAGSPCVDAGAVQTSYSLVFSSHPPTTTATVPMTQAQNVILEESGAVFTAVPVSIPLTLNSNPAGATVAGGPATTSAGVATYPGLTISGPGTGDQLIATLSLNPAITPAPSTSATSTAFNVNPAPQTIVFNAITGINYVNGSVSLYASATSTLPVALTSTTPSVCAVVGTTANLQQSGVCTIEAAQSGGGAFEAARPVYRSFTVYGIPQTISFNTVPASQVADSSVSLFASANPSGLQVSFTSLTTSVCTISGTTANLIAKGNCTIESTQPGNDQYAAAPTVKQSFSVHGVAQTISFNAITGIQRVGVPVSLFATANPSGLPVTFTSLTPSVCTASGSTANLLATGTCRIQATQSGGPVYAAAAAVNQSFHVSSPTT